MKPWGKNKMKNLKITRKALFISLILIFTAIALHGVNPVFKSRFINSKNEEIQKVYGYKTEQNILENDTETNFNLLQKSACNEHSINTEPFFHQKLFENSMQNLEKENLDFKGAVIPHHILAGDIIADITRNFKNKGSITIFIIGPDHYMQASNKIVTTRNSYKIKEGCLHINKEFVDELIKSDNITIDNDVFETEHSIGGVIPFISAFNTNIEIVPLVVRSDLSLEEIDEIAGLLSEYSDNSIFIASVDFSHYLTINKALDNDNETIKLIKEKNYKSLMNLDNGYLDSPEALILLMKTMDYTENSNMTILGHGTSRDYLPEATKDITTYYSLIFK